LYCEISEICYNYKNMRDIIKAFKRIPEKTRTIVYGMFSLLKNLFYFLFKIAVGIIFKSPLLIAIAIYNILIGLVKANCSRGLWKNKDDLKDIQTYIIGGVILSISSLFYIGYTANQVYNPTNTKYNLAIAIIIAAFATFSITKSIVGLIRTKGKTLLIKEYKVTNFATALTNLVLTQIALLSVTAESNMGAYNSFVGVVVGVIILAFGLFLVINGLIKNKAYNKMLTINKNNN